MQSDPSQVKTFFVPSNQAIENISAHIGLPVAKVIGPDMKAVMCNFLKYHIVNGVHQLSDWKAGSSMATNYFGSKLTIKTAGGVGSAEVRSALGSSAKVEVALTCGSAVAYGVDSVLTPFPVPRLG